LSLSDSFQSVCIVTPWGTNSKALSSILLADWFFFKGCPVQIVSTTPICKPVDEAWDRQVRSSKHLKSAFKNKSIVFWFDAPGKLFDACRPTFDFKRNRQVVVFGDSNSPSSLTQKHKLFSRRLSLRPFNWLVPEFDFNATYAEDEGFCCIFSENLSCDFRAQKNLFKDPDKKQHVVLYYSNRSVALDFEILKKNLNLLESRYGDKLVWTIVLSSTPSKKCRKILSEIQKFDTVSDVLIGQSFSELRKKLFDVDWFLTPAGDDYLGSWGAFFYGLNIWSLNDFCSVLKVSNGKKPGLNAFSVEGLDFLLSADSEPLKKAGDVFDFRLLEATKSYALNLNFLLEICCA
jgi:hypothetical protein